MCIRMDKQRAVDAPSTGFNFLYMEKEYLIRNKTTITKYGCFYLPLVRTWNIDVPEVVGALIISGLSEKMGKKNLVNGTFQHAAGTSTFLNDLYRKLSAMFNMMYIDIAGMKNYLNYRSISEISTFSSYSKNVQIIYQYERHAEVLTSEFRNLPRIRGCWSVS